MRKLQEIFNVQNIRIALRERRKIRLFKILNFCIPKSIPQLVQIFFRKFIRCMPRLSLQYFCVRLSNVSCKFFLFRGVFGHIERFFLSDIVKNMFNISPFRCMKTANLNLCINTIDFCIDICSCIA